MVWEVGEGGVVVGKGKLVEWGEVKEGGYGECVGGGKCRGSRGWGGDFKRGW